MLVLAALCPRGGTVLLAPHLGNWEFLNHFLMRRFELVCLYRPPRVAELDGELVELVDTGLVRLEQLARLTQSMQND